MEFGSVESTGKEIRKFVTGSVRDNAEGKGRWDLIPYYPLLRVAVHFENGAKKYGDRNWEKGQPLNEYLSSAMRHLMRFSNGENQEDHLSACIWNCMAFIETQKNIETGRFIVDQVDYLLEHLNPEIAKRIREKLHDNIANAKLKEMGGEIKLKIEEAELDAMIEYYNKQAEVHSGREAMEKMREKQRKESEGILPEIRVGDSVYVREDAKDHFAGKICFASPMERMIGKVYTVEAIEPNSLTYAGDKTLMYKLRADNDCAWWFTRGSLNKVLVRETK